MRSNVSKTRVIGLALVVGSLVSCSAAAPIDPHDSRRSHATVCPPEPTTLDERGEPRNAEGFIRYCWPGETHCYCDSGNDCYALEGYVPCTSASSGTSGTDAGSTSDAMSSGSTSNSSSDACTLAAGQTRLASDGTTVCAPHDATLVLRSDCCDRRRRRCFPPSSTDLACESGEASSGDATSDGSVGSGTTTTTPLPSSEVLPAFDTATDQHVRDLVARGRALGNRHAVVAKIGDSITESGSFLSDAGYGWYTLGLHPEVLPTIQYFSTVDLGGSNSLNRASICATAGWTSGDAIAGGSSSPLVRELDAIRPQWAIIMYGTNDIDRSDLSSFAANMRTIVDITEARAVVPVLSTIPDRLDSARAASLVPSFNDAIRSIARERHLPLIDYNLALAPLPNRGLSADGIHPNTYRIDGDTRSCDFTSAGTQFGYNVRNLTALQMLTRLRNY